MTDTPAIDALRRLRVGEGWDTHQLVTGRPLVLGGVTIAHSHGLLGHSDADVLTHAVIDALLGATGGDDIGTHFPDTDERWRGADSMRLLAQVVSEIVDGETIVLNFESGQ